MVPTAESTRGAAALTLPATPATAATVWHSAPTVGAGFAAAWQGAAEGLSAGTTAPATLEHEVRQLIEQGWPAGAGLGAEGQWRRAGLAGGLEGVALPVAPAGSDAPADAADLSAGQQAFLDRIAPWTRAAGERLGVAPDLVAAHAALESGWGQRPLRDASGQDTHNLFGLKAQAGYAGAQVQALTTEYQAGSPALRSEPFRRYAGEAEAFADYTRLLQDNPRYRAALGTGSDAQAFAQGLARGGYATDPGYAAKLTRLATRLLQSQSRD